MNKRAAAALAADMKSAEDRTQNWDSALVRELHLKMLERSDRIRRAERGRWIGKIYRWRAE